jgi:hypothetical protein
MEKIFEEISKNPLTNHQKCDIINTSKGDTLPRKREEKEK